MTTEFLSLQLIHITHVHPLSFSGYTNLTRQQMSVTCKDIEISTKCKLSYVCISDLGVSLLHKKSLEKEELCQRLKEQLDALEKETASKLSEMDSFNSQLKVFIIFYYIHFWLVAFLPSLFIHSISHYFD